MLFPLISINTFYIILEINSTILVYHIYDGDSISNHSLKKFMLILFNIFLYVQEPHSPSPQPSPAPFRKSILPEQIQPHFSIMEHLTSLHKLIQHSGIYFLIRPLALSKQSSFIVLLSHDINLCLSARSRICSPPASQILELYPETLRLAEAARGYCLQISSKTFPI